MLKRVCAEDEWGKAEVSRGIAEDDPVLGTPGLQGEEQRLDEGRPQKPPEGDASRMGPTWEYGVKLVQGKYVPFHIKCTRQHPDHVNEKRRLDRVTSIIATNRKQG